MDRLSNKVIKMVLNPSAEKVNHWSNTARDEEYMAKVRSETRRRSDED